MDTPKTPRHPSNGYKVANGTPLPSCTAASSPLVAEDICSPYASPSVRRKSLRLEMRSPAKNLDLKLGSVEEEACSPNEEIEVLQKRHKRRRSLRLQERQIDPKSDSTEAVVKKSSTKKSAKKRRQSGLFGVAKSNSTKASAADIIVDGNSVHVSAVSKKSADLKSTSKKKRRQSKCFGVATKHDESQASPIKTMALDIKPFVSEFVLTKEAEAELASALESFATTALTTILEDHELDTDKVGETLNSDRDKLNETLDSLDESFDDEKENKHHLTISAVKRKKGRRDTFDLSRKRGLRVGPSVLEVPTPGSVKSNVQNFEAVKPIGLSLDTTCEANVDRQELKKKLFITPKNNEVNHDVVAEIARALKDDPQNQEVVEVNPEVIARMEMLDSVAVEERMKSLFAEFKVYNYPCVSARIFSAMSLIYSETQEFNPIIPFLTSLVNAEIVSLKNRDENRDVYFINKRVCFSGYDYSSTMPAVDSIDGSHVDLVSSIEALKLVLQEAQQLSTSIHLLDLAIRYLADMSSCKNVSDVCSKTLVGYFPSSRFEKAIKHYSNELKDIRCYLTGNESAAVEHVGVRFRLGDFIGRSVRFHLRKLLNSLPETLIDFFVEDCEERWGRAVEDRSISSILNCSLEKVNQFMITSPKLFDDHEVLPSFFNSDASEMALETGEMKDVRLRVSLKNVGNDVLKDITSDIQSARRFLAGARACKFVWELLCWPGVKQHIRSQGGWDSIESISKVFYDLQLYENSDHQHFTLLRNVDDLAHMLGKSVERFEDTIDFCECAIRKLRRQMISRQKDHAYRTKGTSMYALRMCLDAEKGEKFPVPMFRLEDQD